MANRNPRYFDEVADTYATARPGYPMQVMDRLQEWGALPPGGDVLELGPGTGQATRQLLEAGAGRVLAVELGS